MSCHFLCLASLRLLTVCQWPTPASRRGCHTSQAHTLLSVWPVARHGHWPGWAPVAFSHFQFDAPPMAPALSMQANLPPHLEKSCADGGPTVKSADPSAGRRRAATHTELPCLLPVISRRSKL